MHFMCMACSCVCAWHAPIATPSIAGLQQSRALTLTLTLSLTLTLTLTQDFNGRVRKISVKNFILEDAAKPGRCVILFGRVSKDTFGARP